MEGTSVKIITLLILICARVYAIHSMQTSPLCMLHSPTLCSPFHPETKERSLLWDDCYAVQGLPKERFRILKAKKEILFSYFFTFYELTTWNFVPPWKRKQCKYKLSCSFKLLHQARIRLSFKLNLYNSNDFAGVEYTHVNDDPELSDINWLPPN